MFNFFNFKSRLLLLLLLISTLAYGRNGITGTVINGETGEPLPGVNISVAGRDIGTATDEEGYFTLPKVNENDLLIFQFIGFKTVEIKYDGKKEIHVEMLPEVLKVKPVIVTADRAERRKSPVAFTTLNRNFIEENYGAKDIPMLLKEIPGVYAYSDNGTGVGYSYLSIRGFDAKRVSVMINGIPVNDPEEHSVYWVDMPDVAESATNLQVQKGVGISPYALSAFGGSVNLITTGIAATSSDLTFSYGSYNTAKYAASLNKELPHNLYLNCRLSKINTDGFRDNTAVDLWAYYLKLTKVNDNSFTQLNVYGGKEITHAGWGYSPDFILEENFTDNPYTYHNYVDNFSQPRYELINRYQIAPNLETVNTLFYVHGNGYYEQFKEEQDLWEYGIINSADSLYGDLVRQKWVTKDQGGLVSTLNWHHGKNNTLSLGTYLSWYGSVHHGEVENIYDINDGGGAFTDPASVDFRKEQQYYRYYYNKRYYNFFITEKGTLLDGKLIWQANLYWQNIDFSFEHGNAGLFEGIYRHAYEVTYTHLSPRLGLNYNINKNWNVYFAVSTAAKEPNADDLYDKWYGPDDLGVAPHFAVSDTVYADDGTVDHIEWEKPLVKEEKLTDLEWGIGYGKDNFKADLNVYRMYFNDEIVPFAAVDEDGYDVKGNADETVHEGFEFSGIYFTPQHWEFKVGAAYSRNYFKKFVQENEDGTVAVDYADKRIAGFPDWMVNGDVLYKSGNWKFRLSYRYRGRIYIDNSESKEHSIEPLKDLFNANAVYNFPRKRFNADMKIILQANNLLDVKYYTAGFYNWDKYHGEWYLTNWYIPAATRNFMLTVRLSF